MAPKFGPYLAYWLFREIFKHVGPSSAWAEADHLHFKYWTQVRSAFDPLTIRSSAPGPCWGLRPQNPLPCSPRHGAVPLPPDVAGWNRHCLGLLLITIHMVPRCQGTTYCTSFLQDNTICDGFRGGGFASLDQWLLSSYLVGSACASEK